MHGPRKPVLHIVDSSGVYGAERVILTLLDELRDSESPGILGCIREKETQEVEIALRAREKGILTHYFTMRRGLNPTGIFPIMTFMKREEVAIVHSHGYKSNVLFGILPFRSFPVLSTVHGWLKFGTDRKEKLYEFLDSKALKRLDLAVAVSGQVKEDLVRKGLDQKKIVIIHNGIRTGDGEEKRDPFEIRKRYAVQEDDFIIGTVGRLSHEKGHAYLIEAMAELAKDIGRMKLLIAGDGPLKNDLEHLVEKLGLCGHVKLIGYEEKIGEFLSSIDVFVLPSLTEGLPVSLLEAMAAGKPVIASRVGGTQEVIEDGENGISIPPMDCRAISEAVKFLYAQPESRNRLSKEGQTVVARKFSSRSMAREYERVYQHILFRAGKIRRMDGPV